MPGRRGARSGRGWDALPRRPAGGAPADGELRGADAGCGHFRARRRRGSLSSQSRLGARATNEASGKEQPANESELAREICLRQLAGRPRTRAELAQVLGKRAISEEVIAEVLDRYDEVGIIDDAAFARAWVSTRHHGRGLARRALANELRQRGDGAAGGGGCPGSR